MNAALAAMNTAVFSKFDQLRFEESGQNAERTSRSYLEVLDGQHSDLLTSHKVMGGTEALKHRINGYVCDRQNYRAWNIVNVTEWDSLLVNVALLL